jgi:PhzF family phenazine biosynthesis protein
MTMGNLHRLSAFADGQAGGNPAGVWLGERLPEPGIMQSIATDVGYSETAFVAPRGGQSYDVRYFSPAAEVSFCGHATIATGVVLGRESGEGSYKLHTAVGEVAVTAQLRDGRIEASLLSVDPRHEAATSDLVTEALATLGWELHDLDQSIPAVRAYAGAWHLVLAVSHAERLADLSYDFDALKTLMLRADLTTLQLIWRERDDLFHARNPFPVGGVVEDPATGAAAAALGGYLRDAGLITAPFHFLIRQGEAMGRPSVLTIDVPVSGGIVVSGTAIAI